MAKVVHCRDVGFDCDGIVTGDTTDETLQQVAEHAKNVHGLEEVTADVVEKVTLVMRDDTAA